MQDTGVEIQLQPTKAERKKKPEENIVLSKEGWRGPLYWAYFNWHAKQTGVGILSTTQLNRIIEDSKETPQRQAQAADVVFARGAIVATKDPNENLFPRDEKLSTGQLGNESILFLAQNFDKEPNLQRRLQILAEKKGLLQAKLGEEVSQGIARPEFIINAVTRTRNA